MLRSQTFSLHSPNNVPRVGVSDEMVQQGWYRMWRGAGTVKELSPQQSTRETGAAQVRMATARSRGIPRSLPVIINSWQVVTEDGTAYDILDQTRTGDLLTLSLRESAT